MLSADLKQKIDLLWDQFWSNGMADHMNALRHISYLIFMKKLEDNENDRIIVSKKTGKKYTSIFDGNNTMRWSVWKTWAGDKMRSHVRENVFPFLKKIESNGRIRLDLGDSNFEIESPILLKNAVDVIEDLKISDQNYDTQGDIYEYVLSKLKKAGLNGQFRTPRHIIRMMVELIDPDVNQKICDPACGTGGFLINSYLHILKKYTSKELLEYDKDGKAILPLGNNLTKKERNFLLTDQLFGFDYETSMVQIAQMNMILHGFEKPNISYGNSVGKDFNQKEEYDVILANPPFAGNLNKSEINDNFVESESTTKTELLFLELFYNKLVKGGKGAVIIPTGVLSGESSAHKSLKKFLLNNCQLDGIVYMPTGVFKPYAGVSTAIIFFTKGGKTNSLWLYEMKADGLSLDDKRNPIQENDIPDILEKFPNKVKSEKSIIITIDNIIKNDYNLSFTRYMDTSKPEKEIDVQKTINSLAIIKKERKKIEDQMSKDLQEIGFKI
jgi:type I restriction enzyme M protein